MKTYTAEEVSRLNPDELIDAMLLNERLTPVAHNDTKYQRQEQHKLLKKEIVGRIEECCPKT